MTGHAGKTTAGTNAASVAIIASGPGASNFAGRAARGSAGFAGRLDGNSTAGRIR